MRVGIATVQTPFVQGGAEFLAASLCDAVNAAGHQAEVISIPFKWYPAALIPEHILACRLFDVEESCGVAIDRLIGLKFPAYLMKHPNKVLWLLHQYRSAYDSWDQPHSDLLNAPDGRHVREAIRVADAALLPECKAFYTISAVVSDRLRRFCGIESRPLYHPPPQAELFHCAAYEDFFLFPSRVNQSKRQHLAIEALALVRAPIRLCFMGGIDATEYGQALQARCAALGLQDRVTWLGAVPFEEKLALYARCLGVIFPPIDEDYGYVTLEAMLAAKAVITMTDSGGPLEFVEDGVSGLICAPNAPALAAALAALWQDRAKARALGQAAAARYHELGLGWDHVLEHLLA